MEIRRLSGITSVEYCFANRIYPDHQELIREGSVIFAYGTFTGIPIVGLAGIVISTEIVSGQTIYTTKLTFTMADKGNLTKQILKEISGNPCCFRIRDVYKEHHLIGLDKKPHPTVIYKYANEPVPGGKRGYDIEITYINILSTLQLR